MILYRVWHAMVDDLEEPPSLGSVTNLFYNLRSIGVYVWEIDNGYSGAIRRWFEVWESFRWVYKELWDLGDAQIRQTLHTNLRFIELLYFLHPVIANLHSLSLSLSLSAFVYTYLYLYLFGNDFLSDLVLMLQNYPAHHHNILKMHKYLATSSFFWHKRTIIK